MKNRNSSNITIAFILISFSAFILSACSNLPSVSTSFAPTEARGVPQAGNESFITANSISDLTNRAKLIVVGQVIKKDEVVNMARDANDPSKPDNRIFIVGQVYQATIRQFLKGKEAETIYIVQREGFLGPNVAKNDIEINKARELERFIPLGLGKEYLMFLEPMFGYPEGKYYVGVAQPWRFDISDSNKVFPESPWENAKIVFPPQSISAITQQIESPSIQLPSPYPPPNAPYLPSSSPNPLISSPYP